MSIENIIEALEEERDRLSQAIEALKGASPGGRRGRRPGRHLSAEARRRIGAAMRRRWAERKKKEKAA